MDPEEARGLLRQLASVPDGQIDLAEASLALASLDRPHVHIGRYRDHLTELARDMGEVMTSGLEPGDALPHVLHESLGYRGDAMTYDDVQNANLMRVIDRRKGLPVSLGILYLHAARASGVEGEGLRFPGHFLIRITGYDERKILDPFHGGISRTTTEIRELHKAVAGLDAELAPSHFSAASNRDILVRLQNNLCHRHRQAGRFKELLSVLERILLFAPDRPEILWDTGVVHATLGRIQSAIAAFETLLELPGDHAVRRQAETALASLRRRLN